MNDTFYLYNNEALASCVLLSVLEKVDSIDIARSCLILPFLFDDKTVSFLQNHPNNNYDLKDFVRQHPRFFATFNKRYVELLPITINSFIILKKGNQIEIEKLIFINDKSEIFLGFDLGERFKNINDVVPNFIAMISSYSTTQLYQILNIQL